MKHYIFILFLSLISLSYYGQNKKIKTTKAEPHEKTSYGDKGLLNKKQKKKKQKKSSKKSNYATVEKKETKKRKAIDAEPHVDASNNRKRTARKASKKL
tara:strand:- start:62 stop:358 length:297 start_codon:yes stop_codon:yes gene_type:complete